MNFCAKIKISSLARLARHKWRNWDLSKCILYSKCFWWNIDQMLPRSRKPRKWRISILNQINSVPFVAIFNVVWAFFFVGTSFYVIKMQNETFIGDFNTVYLPKVTLIANYKLSKNSTIFWHIFFRGKMQFYQFFLDIWQDNAYLGRAICP